MYNGNQLYVGILPKSGEDYADSFFGAIRAGCRVLGPARIRPSALGAFWVLSAYLGPVPEKQTVGAELQLLRVVEADNLPRHQATSQFVGLLLP